MVSFRFDEWLRPGAVVAHELSRTTLCTYGRKFQDWNIQAYADLLKVSSILIDIPPRHPSIQLWGPTEGIFSFEC
jgi:hypothetical protein